jgi:DNA repair exonuclease SbcCD nuclease subunit
MRRLLIGDPHVRPDNLQESTALIDFAVDRAKELRVDQIVVLGDLFHTHKVIRMDVLDFWTKAVKKLSDVAFTVLLVGNHDQAGDDQSEWKMSALDPLASIPNSLVVSDNWSDRNGATFIAHTASEEKFAKAVAAVNDKVLFCHQTFNGAAYENGFYAKDGFSLDLISKYQKVVSGHIHKHQEFANLVYPGTPRWDSISDANEKKGLWLMDGLELSLIPTDEVCKPIVAFDVSEGDELPEIKDGVRAVVRLTGSSAWLADASKKLKGKARVSVKPTDKKFDSSDKNKIRSLEAYASHYKTKNGANISDVLKYIGEL